MVWDFGEESCIKSYDDDDDDDEDDNLMESIRKAREEYADRQFKVHETSIAIRDTLSEEEILLLIKLLVESLM